MVQDSIFSSYDLISEQNLSSTSFKRSLDNLRKKKKKKREIHFDNATIHSGIQVRSEAWNEHNERTEYRTRVGRLA